MGLGDDLLITAIAASEKKKYPNRQIIIGNLKKKEASHSIVYDNNPNISDCRNLDFKKEIHLIDYHPENRPYIDYRNSTNKKYIWNSAYKAIPGELYFSKSEINKASNILEEAKKFWTKNNKDNVYKGIIFLETTSTKVEHKNFSIKHLNKSWGEENWNNLINQLKNKYLFVSSVHEHSLQIDGVYRPKLMDFRLACCIMKLSDAYVGPEGGFSHVAGALRKKAVVYYGGWITPNVIGYSFHENLYYSNPISPCGLYREVCPHCDEARKFITVEMFREKIERIL